MSANKFLTMIAVFIYLSPWLRCLTLQRISGNSPVQYGTRSRYRYLYCLTFARLTVYSVHKYSTKLQYWYVGQCNFKNFTSTGTVRKSGPEPLRIWNDWKFCTNQFFFLSKPRLFFQTELLENRVIFFLQKV